MNRIVLGELATEAALLEKHTRHLTDIGKPLRSLALQLAAERENDPLRKLMEEQRARDGVAES